MRENGVHSLSISCDLCRHVALLNVDRFTNDVPVPNFRPRLVCTGCGIIGRADVRLNCEEDAERERITGIQWW
ncbi:MAG TPA: hypothetical protein VKW08_08235 [Xanthobacteraceae bacterium]|nr:hypothetical protein [Xanthobacteraceae bacterium]